MRFISGEIMKADLETFKKLYLQEFGVALTDEDAERRARLLMSLYKAVYSSPEIKKTGYGNRNNTRV